MPVYHTMLHQIDVAETARYAGLFSQRNFPLPLIEEACLEAKLLCSPKAIWEIYAYDSLGALIHSSAPLKLTGQSISNHLAGCVKIAVIAVTIGDALENKAADLFASGGYAAGLLLDAAGTAAVEIAADKLNEFIVSQAAKEGLHAVTRFSPGYGDWDIAVQPHILALANADNIGIHMSSSYMLIPRKSITAVIGLKPAATAAPAHSCRETSCLTCPQQNCLARRR